MKEGSKKWGKKLKRREERKIGRMMIIGKKIEKCYSKKWSINEEKDESMTKNMKILR